MSVKPQGETSRFQVIEGHLYKLITTLAGVSLGVNSYLVKDKIVEISDNLRNMAGAVRTLEMNGALLQQQCNAMNARLDHEGARVERMEATIARIMVKLGLAP